MNTKMTMHDRISAFADGELPEAQVEAVMKDLATPEGRAAWDVYHRAGDVLRSEDMDIALSAGFAARMAARLDAEPTVLAPLPTAQASVGPAHPHPWHRLALPALGAAAVAGLAFVITPSVLNSLRDKPALPAQAATATAAAPAISHASVIASVAPASVGGAISLRSADLDPYVQAHQPVSPAVDGAAQFVSPVAPGSTTAN